MKPSFAIQWHITDECDQRCKHCYIFAEGCPQLESMPYGQDEGSGGKLVVVSG